jgi:hypothetical protein
MKAFTIQQPHVGAILAGLKPWETRSWRTKYRGALILHASGAFDRDWLNNPNRDIRRFAIHASYLRLGAILGIADLTDCRRVEDVPEGPERTWGNFSAGRFAWRLENVRAFPRAIECRGALSFWDPAKVLEPPALASLLEMLGQRVLTDDNGQTLLGGVL